MKDRIVEALRDFRANPKQAFFATDSRLYSELRDGYIDRNLNLTPAGYRLLASSTEGMRNENYPA